MTAEEKDPAFTHFGDPRCVCASPEIALTRDIEQFCIGTPELSLPALVDAIVAEARRMTA